METQSNKSNLNGFDIIRKSNDKMLHHQQLNYPIRHYLTNKKQGARNKNDHIFD